MERIPGSIWRLRESIQQALDALTAEVEGWVPEMEEICNALLHAGSALDLAIAKRGWCPEHRVEVVWLGSPEEGHSQPFICPACTREEVELKKRHGKKKGGKE